MNEYVITRLSDIRIQELRREADLERLAAQARDHRSQSQRRLKRSSGIAWFGRWRAKAATT